MSTLRTLSLVVAATEKNRGIGKNGSLPWCLPNEMKYFTKITSTAPEGKRNAIIMGRKTHESIGKVLKNRINVVISSTMKSQQDLHVCNSLHDAINLLEKMSDCGEMFVIGGASLYQEAMKHPLTKKIYYTLLMSNVECDVFFPQLPKRFELQDSYYETFIENGIPYKFQVYVETHEEVQYLNLCREIIKYGETKMDRTGVGTIGLFGKTMRFNLRESFPLLTTKRVFWKGVVEELLWFIKGSTSEPELSSQGVKIWTDNATREFLDKRGLQDREVGDLGPVYGFQWRHWGASYTNHKSDYSGKGIDQLALCIEMIKKDPTSRRIIMSAWNPSDLDAMALPPCHAFVQFYVMNGELSTLMYQRSCDMGLGVPFNIASYALLTCLVAHVCGLKPGEFVHNLGDTHLYKNHLEAIEEQLGRQPKPFPTLSLNAKISNIDDFTSNDIELIGYNPHGTIKMKMAI